MPNQSRSEFVTDFRVLSSGITTHLTDLEAIGITATDAQDMNAFADELDALHAEQKNLYAQWKAKTAALRSKMETAQARSSALRQRIKLVIPQADWVAYGIKAKR